ncbi:hypothetical protein [Marinimicrobium alkaliphilum]|uniref:hypothetical protein n=1 Tax=Marinimicrobium alkaliphilum TaxID=2202654 RepID=UPI000DBA5AFD|nr:hypothetical protein [Marinimicrobium alkaliphilum]
MNTLKTIKRVAPVIGLLISSLPLAAAAFTLTISGEGGDPGEKASSRDCQRGGQEAFTHAAGSTEYTDEEFFSGTKGLRLEIKEGRTGWGSLGGVVNFEDCSHAGGRHLTRGDELWVRTRLFFPVGFEFMDRGRHKFLRARHYSMVDGQKISEGYLNLYINPQVNDPEYKPFAYILEAHVPGGLRWASVGESRHFFQLGQWHTVEYYVKLDTVTAADGGQALIRVWVDGELIGEIDNRITLINPDSWVESLYYFTYWNDEGPDRTMHFYADDIVITSDTPADRDEQGNPFIGVGGDQSSRPRPPAPLN